MAEIVRQHHQNLQDKDIALFESKEDRENTINEVLSEIPEDQKYPATDEEQDKILIFKDQVHAALKSTKNRSATGLDGCPYKLWKALNKRHKDAVKKNKPSFDIITTLTLIFQDIQQHSIDESTDFTSRWMCPIYKKKDKTKIENYCLITLLNRDYKLLTKALVLQLIQSIKCMIHPDQVGFIPGRMIFNHIRLTKIMIKYAKVMETNRAIIVLDQEKAYDQINHTYLWKTLEAFCIPPPFRNTIRSLYETTSTSHQQTVEIPVDTVDIVDAIDIIVVP
jgi:hypothetical protein